MARPLVEAPSEGTRPVVVAVVVSYGDTRPTVSCVRSLVTCGYKQLTVLVVDNDPTADSGGELAKELQPWGVRVLAPRSNLGYGGAANLGIAEAARLDARFVWILNNDLTVEHGCLSLLVNAMVEHPELGAIGPKVLAPAGPEVSLGVWFAGGEFDLRRGAARHLHAIATSQPIAETEYVTGAAILLRLSAVRDVGPFWDDLFLYWEDVELSIRLAKAKWGLAVAQHATVYHAVHGSVTPQVARTYFYRNAILVTARHGSARDLMALHVHLLLRLARRWLGALARREELPTTETASAIRGSLRSLRPEGVRCQRTQKYRVGERRRRA